MVNKRGSESIVWPQIIWIIAFSFFFFVSIVFINRAVSGAYIQEEINSKKIALILDGARPGSVFHIDISDAIAVAKKNNRDCAFSFASGKNECFFVSDNKVVVALSDSRMGYEQTYFSDYKVDLTVVGEELIIGVSDE